MPAAARSCKAKAIRPKAMYINIHYIAFKRLGEGILYLREKTALKKYVLIV